MAKFEASDEGVRAFVTSTTSKPTVNPPKFWRGNPGAMAVEARTVKRPEIVDLLAAADDEADERVGASTASTRSCDPSET